MRPRLSGNILKAYKRLVKAERQEVHVEFKSAITTVDTIVKRVVAAAQLLASSMLAVAILNRDSGKGNDASVTQTVDYCKSRLHVQRTHLNANLVSKLSGADLPTAASAIIEVQSDAGSDVSTAKKFKKMRLV